jgi:molybdate transport system permease protein
VNRRLRRRPPVVVVAVGVVALGFFALPLSGILQRADWGNLWADLSTPQSTQALRLSLLVSLYATALTVVLGTPLAWLLARTNIPGRGLLRGLVLLPMVLPPVVGGVALLSAFSLSSPIGRWLNDTFGIQFTFHPIGVVMAATFVAMPFYVITVEAALRNVDQRYEQVAASLGASRVTVFRRVTLPLIAPSLVAGSVLAWARSLGEFGATITFAGNIIGRTQTLPLAVFLRLESDPDAAIALSLVLLAVSFVVLVSLRDKWLVRG